MTPPVRLLFVFGTRPEAIKMAPLVLAARRQPLRFDVRVAVTAQHRQMLDEVLSLFEIVPDDDLAVMEPGQTLHGLTAKIFSALPSVLERHAPHVLIAQGDTTTTFAAAAAAFYARIPIAHVEAGLRTGNLLAPFPEEGNRRMVSAVARWHFAPTEQARANLLRESIPEDRVHVTGNTVIDALLWMRGRLAGARPGIPGLPSDASEAIASGQRPMVLITGHRRENFGPPFRRLCEALGRLARAHRDVLFLYPVHLNPNVQEPVRESLGQEPNLHLLPPQDYERFVWLLEHSRLVITDSGGVQEEAPALGKPVLVMREVTERPEAVEAGVVRLVGQDGDRLFAEASRLLTDEAAYRAMARGISPYGDGQASERILAVLEREAASAGL